jgi:hypothetical protein
MHYSYRNEEAVIAYNAFRGRAAEAAQPSWFERWIGGGIVSDSDWISGTSDRLATSGTYSGSRREWSYADDTACVLHPVKSSRHRKIKPQRR